MLPVLSRNEQIAGIIKTANSGNRFYTVRDKALFLI